MPTLTILPTDIQGLVRQLNTLIAEKHLEPTIEDGRVVLYRKVKYT